MSITDELREWVSNHYTGWSSKQAEGFAIADRIDAEHERCCKALDEAWAATAHQVHEQVMEELADEWVKLPVDADGEVIRVGDELVSTYDGIECVSSVKALILSDRWDFELSDEVGDTRDVVSLQDFYENTRHYHTPTVEDVLRDMHMKLDEVTALYVGEAIDSDERDRDEARIFAEYAKRLTLAEGD